MCHVRIIAIQKQLYKNKLFIKENGQMNNLTGKINPKTEEEFQPATVHDIAAMINEAKKSDQSIAIVMRHAPFNNETKGLTDEGVLIATKLGDLLENSGITINKIFVSPEVRAKQTASKISPTAPLQELEEIGSAKSGKNPYTDEELTELKSQAQTQNITIEKAVIRSSKLRSKNIERGTETAEAILKNLEPGKTILFVSHGARIEPAICELTQSQLDTTLILPTLGMVILIIDPNNKKVSAWTYYNCN